MKPDQSCVYHVLSDVLGREHFPHISLVSLRNSAAKRRFHDSTTRGTGITLTGALCHSIRKKRFSEPLMLAETRNVFFVSFLS